MLRASEITVVGAINASLETDGQSEQTPRVPVLAIYAGSPLASRQVVLSHVPQAEYIEITDSGHLLMLEKPAEFNRILLEFFGHTHQTHVDGRRGVDLLPRLSSISSLVATRPTCERPCSSRFSFTLSL
jgi:hypothetical protein